MISPLCFPHSLLLILNSSYSTYYPFSSHYFCLPSFLLSDIWFISLKNYHWRKFLFLTPTLTSPLLGLCISWLPSFHNSQSVIVIPSWSAWRPLSVLMWLNGFLNSRIITTRKKPFKTLHNLSHHQGIFYFSLTLRDPSKDPSLPQVRSIHSLLLTNLRRQRNFILPLFHYFYDSMHSKYGSFVTKQCTVKTAESCDTNK